MVLVWNIGFAAILLSTEAGSCPKKILGTTGMYFFVQWALIFILLSLLIVSSSDLITAHYLKVHLPLFIAAETKEIRHDVCTHNSVT